jgi:Skp family chaperone for outer membrane proteins
MSRRNPCLAVLTLLGLLAGCDGVVPQAKTTDATATSASSLAGESADRKTSAGVAVIDLDEVARRLGAESEILSEMKDKEKQLNDELQTLQASYTRQLESKRRTLNVQPTEEQTAELQELDRHLGAKLQEAQLDAQRTLARHRATLINRLRERVRPIARDVANRRGLETVVLKNLDLLFHYSAEADITDEVVEKLMAHGSSTTTSPAEPVASPYAPTTSPPASEYPPSFYERTARQPGQSPERR